MLLPPRGGRFTVRGYYLYLYTKQKQKSGIRIKIRNCMRLNVTVNTVPLWGQTLEAYHLFSAYYLGCYFFCDALHITR